MTILLNHLFTAALTKVIWLKLTLSCNSLLYISSVAHKHKHYRLIKTGKYYSKVIKTKQRSLACFRQIEPNEEKRKCFD